MSLFTEENLEYAREVAPDQTEEETEDWFDNDPSYYAEVINENTDSEVEAWVEGDSLRLDIEALWDVPANVSKEYAVLQMLMRFEGDLMSSSEITKEMSKHWTS